MFEIVLDPDTQEPKAFNEPRWVGRKSYASFADA